MGTFVLVDYFAGIQSERIFFYIQKPSFYWKGIFALFILLGERASECGGEQSVLLKLENSNYLEILREKTTKRWI